MEITILLPCLLLLTLANAQRSSYQNYDDWKPLDRPHQWTRLSSGLTSEPEATTTSYFTLGSSGYHQDDTRSYQDNSKEFVDPSKQYPDGSQQYHGEDSYSSDFKNHPYEYPDPSVLDHSSSVEEYGYGPGDNFNITVERLGGFGGTGDTRGYGAYDYPKEQGSYDFPKEQHVGYEYPREHHAVHPDAKLSTGFPDLLRIGRSRNRYHVREPPYVHPLPPPL